MAFAITSFNQWFTLFSQDTILVQGVAFKKAFSYAGFEMQQKKYENPKIAMLNVELELKAERENAEVRVDNVQVGLISVGICCQCEAGSGAVRLHASFYIACRRWGLWQMYGGRFKFLSSYS